MCWNVPWKKPTNEAGRTRTTEARDSRRGIPQGSPLSPTGWQIFTSAGFVLDGRSSALSKASALRLVNYAGRSCDPVPEGQRGECAAPTLRAIMGKLKLTVNEEKDRICTVPDGSFDFLGYTFWGRMYSPTTGKARLGLPAVKERASSAWSKESTR